MSMDKPSRPYNLLGVVEATTAPAKLQTPEQQLAWILGRSRDILVAVAQLEARLLGVYPDADAKAAQGEGPDGGLIANITMTTGEIESALAKAHGRLIELRERLGG